MSRRATAAVIGAMLVAAAGCSGHTGHRRASSTPPGSTSATPSYPAHPRAATRKAWQRGGIRPVSGVSIVDGTGFVYEARQHQMFLRAFDPRTGATDWATMASTGVQPPGEYVAVSSVSNQVVFFQPPDPSHPQIARLVFTTPGHASALPTIHAEARAWEDTPTQCGSQVCASALAYDTATKTWNVQAYRINPHTGASGPDTHAPSGYRELGSGLVDLLGRHPEKLARRDHDRTVWVRSLTDLTGPGVSTDNGWSTHQFQHDAITTLTVYRNSRPPVGVRDFRLDLSTGMISVGLDTKTGKLLWRRTGESIGCETSLAMQRVHQLTAGHPPGTG